MKRKHWAFVFVVCALLAGLLWVLPQTKQETYYNDTFKISFTKTKEYVPTVTQNAMSGKLSESLTYVFFYNDVYSYVSENIRNSVDRHEMDFDSAIFNAGFTNPIYLSSFIKNVFDDEDFEFYQFEKVSLSDSVGAYRCYFNSLSTRINGRCYFTVDDARFYVFIFYISKNSDEQKAEEAMIDRVMASLVIYPYDYIEE